MNQRRLVQPITERDIRASFVNCSKGEAQRLAVPRELAETAWDDLDFLMTARRSGAAGRRGNSVGQYLCHDLACSFYVRGLRAPAAGADLDESLSYADKIARARVNLDAFLDKVTA